MGWMQPFQHTNGNFYRWSVDRKTSGRPLAAQVWRNGGWARVRNIDTLDGVWNVANGLPFEHNHRKGQ